MNQPIVSIGMPVYNGQEFISQAIDSLLSQTYKEIELIISDNASTDSTRDICMNYVKQDTRVRFYESNRNQGAIANFEKVLKMANSDYFMWAAHDDLWEPNYISTLIDLIKNDEEVVLSFSMFNSIDEEGIEIAKCPHVLDIPSDDLYQLLSNYINQYERLGKSCLIYGLMKTSFAISSFRSTLDLFKDNVWGLDLLFVFQVLTLGKLSISKDILFHKRVLATNESSKYNRSDDWYSYFNAYKYLIVNSVTLTEVQKKCLIAEVWERQKNSYTKRLNDVSIPSYLLLSEKLDNYSSKTSYSHSGEDIIVKQIFDEINIVKPSYLDIGAYHPEILSNTALLYDKGCNGINIEVNPHLLNSFLKKRPKDINLNLSVGLENKELEFYVMSIPTLSTFSREEAQKIIKETKHTLQEIIPIQAVTINHVIDSYAGKLFPDFLNLNSYRMDLSILQSINYQISYPIVICINTIALSETGEEAKKQETVDFLSSKGYMAYADTHMNTIFVKKDLWKQKRKANKITNLPPILLQDNRKKIYDPIYLVKKLDMLLGEFNHIRSQLEVEKEKRSSLESSKFWKLRNFWLKLKYLIGKSESIKDSSLEQSGGTNNQVNLSQAFLHSKSYDPLYLESQIDILSTQIDSSLCQLEFEKQMIDCIENSRFWGLRNDWLKLKSFFKRY